jgi:putative glutamine amidotransferase
LSASEQSTRPQPVIGLTTYVEPARHGAWEERCALLAYNYVDAVARAGGYPVLLPPSPSEVATALRVVDGLILTGGPDLDPRLYGSAPHGETDSPREERDAWEMALCRGALLGGVPLLAICRGLQILNVSLSGTLHQHLPEVVGHDAHRAELGHPTPNRLALDPGSAVGSVLGAETEGRCHHHQGVDRLGDGLRAVGFADDGTVEAVEVVGATFAMGVQWHPEENLDDLRLFIALVEAAAGYQAGREVAGGPAALARVGRP